MAHKTCVTNPVPISKHVVVQGYIFYVEEYMLHYKNKISDSRELVTKEIQPYPCFFVPLSSSYNTNQDDLFCN